MSTSLQCPLCGEPDSALHILSGCKHSTMSSTATDRQNPASTIFFKGISKGLLGQALPPWKLTAQIVLL
eukprot:1159113-Pelagomonas_calceolata.AAC.13